MRTATTLCLAAAAAIALAGPAAAQAGPNQCDGFLRFLSYHSAIAPGGEEVQYFAQVHSTFADMGMQAKLSSIAPITIGGVTYPPLRPVDSFEIRGGQQRTVYLLTLRVPGAAAPPAHLVGLSVRFTCPGTFHRRPQDRYDRP